MNLIAPLLLSLCAVAMCAAPASAETVLARESAPFTADAYGDVIAWSAYDPFTKTYRLRVLRSGQRADPPVARNLQPFDLDVGPGPDGKPVIVYAHDGNLFQYDGTTESPLAEVNSSLIESQPSIHRGSLAFVRQRSKRGRPTVYLRSGGDTKRQPRPRYRRTIGVDNLELSARGLFVTWRTDIAPTCCSSATLYRVKGSRLQHIFRVGSGGANFGQIVTPGVSGLSVYFGRTNQGSGQGNRFFRYDLGTRRLFSARGTSQARSLTWRGGRFLMSRETRSCQPEINATTAGCLLVLTDPITFSPASGADVRRTRP
jgi:hypothetical protein